MSVSSGVLKILRMLASRPLIWDVYHAPPTGVTTATLVALGQTVWASIRGESQKLWGYWASAPLR